MIDCEHFKAKVKICASPQFFQWIFGYNGMVRINQLEIVKTDSSWRIYSTNTPIVYQMNSKQMSEDGYEFFISLNGVWFTKVVPAQYLKH